MYFFSLFSSKYNKMPYKSITILLLLLLLQLLSHVSAGRPLKCQTRTPLQPHRVKYTVEFFHWRQSFRTHTHIHHSLRMASQMCAFNVALYCVVDKYTVQCSFQNMKFFPDILHRAVSVRNGEFKSVTVITCYLFNGT